MRRTTAECAEKTRETYAGKLSHYFLAKFVDSVIVKLIKVNVLSVSLRAGGLRVTSYAGRNQIALFTAAGRREAVGRQACRPRRRKSHCFRLRSIRRRGCERKARFAADGSICETGNRRACGAFRSQTCGRKTTCAHACSLGFAHDRKTQG